MRVLLLLLLLLLLVAVSTRIIVVVVAFVVLLGLLLLLVRLLLRLQRLGGTPASPIVPRLGGTPASPIVLLVLLLHPARMHIRRSNVHSCILVLLSLLGRGFV